MLKPYNLYNVLIHQCNKVETRKNLTNPWFFRLVATLYQARFSESTHRNFLTGIQYPAGAAIILKPVIMASITMTPRMLWHPVLQCIQY